MMKELERSLTSFDELRQFVHETLCQSENLLANQFETYESVLSSRDRVCGLEFSLQGLRSVRLGAIWAADPNIIYFYNARGDRYLKVRLTERLSLTELETTNV